MAHIVLRLVENFIIACTVLFLLNTALAALTLAVAVALKPVTNLVTPLAWVKAFLTAIHGVDVAGNLGELVPKLISFDLQTAGISSRNRDGRLEVRLLMNVFHHVAWLNKVVGPLQSRMTTSSYRGLRRGAYFWRLWHRLHRTCQEGRRGIRCQSIAHHKELARFVVYLNLFLQSLVIFFIASNLLSREKGLSLVLECFHEAFSLEVRVEAHVRPDLPRLFSRSHLPNCPLWVCRLAIDVAVSCSGCGQALVVGAHSSKRHAWWA